MLGYSRSSWGLAEYTIPKYATWPQWLFWAKDTWKTIGTRRMLWPTLPFLPENRKFPCERYPFDTRRKETVLSSAMGDQGQENSYKQNLLEVTPKWSRTLRPHPLPQVQVSSVQLLSHVWLFVTPMDCSTPGLPVHHQLPEFTQTHVHWCHPTVSSSVISFFSHLQSFPASGKSVPDESVLCIRWPKYWSFSFSISPSSEYLGLISFRMDWLDLLAV